MTHLHHAPRTIGRLLVAAACVAGCIGAARTAVAGGHDAIEKRYFLRSQGKSWHSGWYSPSEGRPIALVVPPTAEFQSQYSWGVPSSRVMPLYHQFRRPYPGPGAVPGGSPFRPTPNIPSDTVQFGVNAVRGPW
jgi:hypothetical protein